MIRSAIPALLFAAWLLFGIPSAWAGEKTYSLNVPSAAASTALRELAEQTGLQLIYPTDILLDARTRRVKGAMSAKEALARMLDGTGLTSIRDERSGAYLITQASPLPNRNPSDGKNPSLEDDSANHTEISRDMNENTRKIGPLIKSLLGLAVAGQIVAQEGGGNDEGEIYELSPFTVDTKNDTGYRATTTLAGTRLNTQIKDIGSAISVLTEELFQDTGATDAATVLSYALNAEVTGVQGNYSGGADGNLESMRTKPQTNGQRIRGLGSASLTRDYFLTDIPFDSYNTESVTINRGPNSLLFGVGEPGGIINNSNKQASLGRSFGEASVRLGERGSNRFTFDVNRTLIEDRLAVRFSLLRDDEKYQQRPAYEEDERFYFAFNSVLAKNENSEFLGLTRLRGSFEDGKIRSNPPSVQPPTDSLTDWFENPSRSLEALTGTSLPGYVDDGSFTPKNTVDGRPGLVNNQIPASLLPGPWWINFSYIHEDPSSPVSNLSGTSLDGYMGRILYNSDSSQQRPRFDLFYTDSLVGAQPGFTTPSISSQIFDNENILISGMMNEVVQDFQARNIVLEQAFFNNKAGIELAFDKQTYKNDAVLANGSGNSANLRVDVNEYIQVGAPGSKNGDMINPNLGRVYLSAFPWDAFRESETEREAFRATAFYELDFTDNDRASWLGRHVFTGLYSEQTIDDTRRNYENVWNDNGSVDIQEPLFAPVNGGRRKVVSMFYLTPPLHNDSSIDSVSDIRITDYIHANVPMAGDTGSFSYWNNTTKQFGVDTFVVDRPLMGGNREQQNINSKAVSWQSYFFGGNLVGLLGYREDDTEGFDPIGSNILSDGSYDPANLFLDPASSVKEGGDTLTWSVVGHLPWELPGGTGLSFHYNESENFSPQGVRRTIFGDLTSAPGGETKEYGVTFNLFESKVVARLNWFETNRARADGGVGALGSSHSWIGQWMGRWKEGEEAGMSLPDALAFVSENGALGSYPSSWTTYQDVYSEILSWLPASVQSQMNYRFENGVVVSDPISGLASTKSFVTEGFEIDLTGNITPNWRLAVNVGQQETVQSDTAPALSEFAIGPGGVWEKLQASPLAPFWDSPFRGKERGFADRYSNGVVNPIVAALSKDGTVSAEQRKWRANLTTNYFFAEDSKLSGFGVGGAVRWQDKVATGYRQIPTGDGLVSPDLSSPFFGPDQLNGDLWFSYQQKLGDGKMTWKSQLNIRNAFGDDDPIPVVTNPDGRVAIFRNPNPTEIFLTNTLSF